MSKTSESSLQFSFCSYPALGDAAFSLSQWERQKKALLKGSQCFFICGKLILRPDSGFCLWSQQGEMDLEFGGEWLWMGEAGVAGEWIAVELNPQHLVALEDGRWRLNAPYVKAQRLSPKLQNVKPLNTDGALLRYRAEFLGGLRASLNSIGLEAVETPYLVPCPGMEPTLEPFATEWNWGGQATTYFMPTSPELHLKRMLAHGWTDIFEIKTCFRNKEWSAHHQPEFLMLEWYRAFKDLSQIKRDIKELLQKLHELRLIADGLPEIETVSYSDLFQEYLGFVLTPRTTQSELTELCAKHGIQTHPSDSWDDVFFRLSLEKIEPFLKDRGALIIENFPPSQAALARLTADGWADRFEFYWRGLEIANAFHELNDPAEQERRFENEVQARKRLGTRAIEPDWEFLNHLKAGMPPASGVALGVERLMLACSDRGDLAEIRAFPFTCPY